MWIASRPQFIWPWPISISVGIGSHSTDPLWKQDRQALGPWLERREIGHAFLFTMSSFPCQEPYYVCRVIYNHKRTLVVRHVPDTLILFFSFLSPLFTRVGFAPQTIPKPSHNCPSSNVPLLCTQWISRSLNLHWVNRIIRSVLSEDSKWHLRRLQKSCLDPFTYAVFTAVWCPFSTLSSMRTI